MKENPFGNSLVLLLPPRNYAYWTGQWVLSTHRSSKTQMLQNSSVTFKIYMLLSLQTWPLAISFLFVTHIT